MATSKISEVIHHLRRAVVLQEGAGLTDGQLLGCFIKHRDEAAFTALVRRHGPLVWGVCQRVLCSHHDAEDAFQATFLILIRKAASIASRELLANWLYGVAYNTALKARSLAVRRKAREKQMTQMPEPEPVRPDPWRDLQPLLDQELSRLPDKYRVPIVLCDLEGKTRKEAARQLGCPEGTIAGRLARARALLAKRLTRHGLAVSGGALAAVLSKSTSSACVPPLVVSSTIKAVAAAAAGQISLKVAALTEGVMKAMLLNKLKIATVVLLTTGVLTFSAGTLFVPTAVGTAAGGEKKKEFQQEDSAKGGESCAVQVRINGPLGMKVCVLTPAGQVNKIAPIEAPGRLNLEQGKRFRLKLTDIPNRPGVERFPMVEISKLDAKAEPFVTSSAIPIEFTDEDFDQVNDGRAITKVVYLTTGTKGKKTVARPMAKPDTERQKTVGRPGMAGSGPMRAEAGEDLGQAHTIASYHYPQQDVIEVARRRGMVLAVVRMGDIDLEKTGKPTKVVIGDDGIQGRVRRLEKGTPKAKANNNRADQLADQLEHIMRDIDTVQAENQKLRQQLKAAELETRSLQTLLERKERELKKAKASDRK